MVKQPVVVVGGVVWVDIWLYRANAPLATFTQPENIELTVVAAVVFNKGMLVKPVQFWNS